MRGGSEGRSADGRSAVCNTTAPGAKPDKDSDKRGKHRSLVPTSRDCDKISKIACKDAPNLEESGSSRSLMKCVSMIELTKSSRDVIERSRFNVLNETMDEESISADPHASYYPDNVRNYSTRNGLGTGVGLVRRACNYHGIHRTNSERRRTSMCGELNNGARFADEPPRIRRILPELPVVSKTQHLLPDEKQSTVYEASGGHQHKTRHHSVEFKETSSLTQFAKKNGSTLTQFSKRNGVHFSPERSNAMKRVEASSGDDLSDTSDSETMRYNCKSRTIVKIPKEEAPQNGAQTKTTRKYRLTPYAELQSTTESPRGYSNTAISPKEVDPSNLLNRFDSLQSVDRINEKTENSDHNGDADDTSFDTESYTKEMHHRSFDRCTRIQEPLSYGRNIEYTIPKFQQASSPKNLDDVSTNNTAHIQPGVNHTVAVNSPTLNSRHLIQIGAFENGNGFKALSKSLSSSKELTFSNGPDRSNERTLQHSYGNSKTHNAAPVSNNDKSDQRVPFNGNYCQRKSCTQLSADDCNPSLFSLLRSCDLVTLQIDNFSKLIDVEFRTLWSKNVQNGCGGQSLFPCGRDGCELIHFSPTNDKKLCAWEEVRDGNLTERLRLSAFKPVEKGLRQQESGCCRCMQKLVVVSLVRRTSPTNQPSGLFDGDYIVEINERYVLGAPLADISDHVTRCGVSLRLVVARPRRPAPTQTPPTVKPSTPSHCPAPTQTPPTAPPSRQSHPTSFHSITAPTLSYNHFVPSKADTFEALRQPDFLTQSGNPLLVSNAHSIATDDVFLYASSANGTREKSEQSACWNSRERFDSGDSFESSSSCSEEEVEAAYDSEYGWQRVSAV